jgi:hypothetical protein
MAEVGELLNSVIWVVVALISLIPLVIFFISYRRIKSRRLLFTTIAFALFFLKALILSFKLFTPASNDEIWYLDDEFWWSVAAFLDIAIIGSIAFALRLKD